MTRSSLLASLVSALIVPAFPAFAGDFVVGLGTTDFDAAGEILELEYHAEPFTRFLGADVSFSGVLTYQSSDDVFVGFGLSAVRPIGTQGWFIESSFMPGFFDAGSEETDLGNTVEFHSLIGVGRPVGDSYSLSLAVSHKSNGGLGDTNPGVNAVTLRLRREF